MEALLSQHPTRALPLYLTNLHHNKQPNLSKCTPTNLIRALLTQPKLKPLLLTLCWQWSHQSIHTSADDASDITKVLSAKRSRQIQVCKHYIFQHANHTNNQLVDRGANGGLAGSDMRVIYKLTARSTFQALTTMKLLVLMWSLLQPSSTPLWEKSLESLMNMPTLGRDPPSIHQVNLNGLKPLLMKKPSKLVAPNLSLLWMDTLSLSSSEMV